MSTVWTMIDRENALGLGYVRVDVEVTFAGDGAPSADIDDVRVLRVIPRDGRPMLEPLTREELVTVRDWAEDRVERAYAARREDEDTAIRVPEDDELDDPVADTLVEDDE